MNRTSSLRIKRPQSKRDGGRPAKTTDSETKSNNSTGPQSRQQSWSAACGRCWEFQRVLRRSPPTHILYAADGTTKKQSEKTIRIYGLAVNDTEIYETPVKEENEGRANKYARQCNVAGRAKRGHMSMVVVPVCWRTLHGASIPALLLHLSRCVRLPGTLRGSRSITEGGRGGEGGTGGMIRNEASLRTNSCI